ncbi:HAD-IA family hydrolase [Mesorhizobium sp. NBSH29]|uniref:HAD family hydrolase n=1 Tax=Mesorhizobium sp. NBSH29 TaxID=2654249 RepID=UPI0018965217|nr:HAD family hydrolase [Mesorhizobium sp. NBSH29]QPC86695.1 HAD-IA family hydrolase [Mesorhizobium sp. NBSH29]
MAKIKGILFDKDGTLVDFQATWFAIGTRMAHKAADQDRTRANLLMEEAGYDFAHNRFRADSVFAAGTNADIVALWYPQATDVERRELVTLFDTISATEGALQAVPLLGAREAVATLHASGLKLGVATNDSTGGAEKTLLALGIAQMFVAAYGYDAVANPKPAPDAIYAFCDLTGLKPAELAMVGDNRHDLDMARAGGAGLAIGVLSGTGTAETLASADVILGSVAELPEFLAGRK